jgi:CRISPR-associated endonuclease/helicase Cas3
MYIAHINDRGEVQTTKEHSINSAQIAKKRLEAIGLGNLAYLAGVLHDAGKCSKEFNKYISDAVAGLSVKKGSVIHSFAGCGYMMAKFHTNNLDIPDLTAELVAYSIGAHHGLFDCINSNGESEFKNRQEKQPEYDANAMKEYFSECVSENDIEDMFFLANKDVERVIGTLQALVDSEKPDKYSTEFLFYVGLLERLLLSSVIDGDHTDTYSFMSGHKIPEDKELTDWNEIVKNVDDYILSKEVKTEIQRARRELSDICSEFAERPGDVYQLSIPTGSGKTLSGLRYAVHHAKKWGKKRIIYVAPLISILEQNAQVIREAVGRSEIVLEHHSNVVTDNEKSEDVPQDNYRLLTETWDSPIIVTTLVQFLNTLFGGKSSQIRRFSSLCNSIIILDEVQTVPWKATSLFNLAINFLKTVCNATVLLCSATQPTFSGMEHAMKVSSIGFLTQEQERHYSAVFRRSKIRFVGNYRIDEIPRYITGLLADRKSVLLICNKKMQSEFLYDELKQGEYNAYHLSASMCVEHREQTVKQMRCSLSSDVKTLCVSTQVIEAGVDISFSAVVRLEAGLDSIVQANGRCNRNGELGEVAETYIIRCSDENLSKLREMQIAKGATTDLIYDFERDKEKYENEIDSTKSVDTYYSNIRKSFTKEYFDYQVSSENTTLLSWLSDNGGWRGNKSVPLLLNQAFKSAGMEFEPLDGDTVSILVPYGEGKEIIADLCSERVRHDLEFCKTLIRKANRYCVSVMSYQLQILQRLNALYTVADDSVYVLKESFYDNATGLRIKGKEDNSCSILIL